MSRFSRSRVSISFKDSVSVTSQEFVRECDVNNLVKRYSQGLMPASSYVPQFLDVSDLPTFEQAHDMVVSARESFMKLPPHVREVFGNDPGRFLAEYNKSDSPLLRSLGLKPSSDDSKPSPAPAPKAGAKKVSGAPAEALPDASE